MTAAGEPRKAMGFVAIDAGSSTYPDREENPAPLAEFIVPGERVEFAEDGCVTHWTTSGLDVAPYLTVALPRRPAERRDVRVHAVGGVSRKDFEERSPAPWTRCTPAWCRRWSSRATRCST
jgi:hypothetical protein